MVAELSLRLLDHGFLLGHDSYRQPLTLMREAVVKIYRMRRVLLDSEMSVGVVVDSTAIGNLWPKQFISFTVSPGDHWAQIRYMFIRRSFQIKLSLAEVDEITLMTRIRPIGSPTLRQRSNTRYCNVGKRKRSQSGPQESGNNRVRLGAATSIDGCGHLFARSPHHGCNRQS